MKTNYKKEVKEMTKKIEKLRELAEEVMALGERERIEAVKRNAKRALASIAMLEFNIAVIDD